MKQTRRDDWRVRFTITPYSLADLGIEGLRDVAGQVTSGAITVEVAPRRLGALGGGISMSDSLASSDIEGDYARRCEEIASELRRLRQVTDVEVACSETHTCSHCGYRWEVLTAEEAADDSTNQDEHSVEGEPVCCEAAVNEFRAERGIPLLPETGGVR